MSILHFEWSKRLRSAGEVLRRDGLSQRAAAIMVDLVTTTGSYKSAMAIAQAAKYDGYWTEQVDDGFHKEMAWLEAEARKIAAARLAPRDAEGAA